MHVCGPREHCTIDNVTLTASSHWSFNDEKAIGINTFQFYWEVHQRLKYELSPEWLNICVPSQREHFKCETSTVLTILSQNKWCLQPHKNILVISRRQKWLLVSHRDQIILLNMNLMPYKWSWGWQYGYSFVRNILWWSIFFVSHMMILWRRNDFHITGPLWGESTGHQWIPLTRTSNGDICGIFVVCLNKLLNKMLTVVREIHWSPVDSPHKGS